jgi:hypothetical protein
MKILDIIESKHWLNTETGQTASIYGAVPWIGEQGPWQIVVRGYTWRLDNGTVGLGRQPAKTKTEALEVMKQFNQRSE